MKLRKKLIIDLEDELHTAIKTTAAENGISIKKYVLRAVVNQMKKENVHESLLRKSDMHYLQD